jgi:NSS family neurotransmitter:Na+ symporter
VTRSGASAGLEFFLSPDFSKLGAEGLVAAVGQAFFVLGIGMASVMILGGMRREKNAKIAKDSSIVIGSVSVMALLAGLMVFPLVFAFGLEPDSGAGLAFLTIPNIFNEMPAMLGMVIGTLFYLVLYLAIITTTLAIVEGLTDCFKEQFNWSRPKSMIITYLAAFATGIPCIYSTELFGWIDYIITYCLIISAILVSIFVGWLWKTKNLAEVAGMKNPVLIRYFDVILKFVGPIAMIVIFVNMFRSQFGL